MTNQYITQQNHVASEKQIGKPKIYYSKLHAYFFLLITQKIIHGENDFKIQFSFNHIFLKTRRKVLFYRCDQTPGDLTFPQLHCKSALPLAVASTQIATNSAYHISA